MTDQQFERDLKAVLRDLAGLEAPISLRQRVATVMADAPAIRRPWFRSPMRLSLAGVAVVAVVAVAFFASQSLQVVGPPPSASPVEPSPSVLTPSPSPLPSGSPVEPSPSSAITTPTPAAGWSGLHWSAPVTGPGTDNGRLVISNVQAWKQTFVGAGLLVIHDPVADTDVGEAPVFLSSPDGLHWAISQQGPTDSGSQCSGELETPHHLLVAPDGSLIAASDSCAPGSNAPKLWGSTDGSTWSVIQSPSWQAIWAPAGGANTLLALAATPQGIVAIGEKGQFCCGHAIGPDAGRAIIAFSTDGSTWTLLELSDAFKDADLADVVAYAGGFAIVGRVGDPDWTSDPVAGQIIVSGVGQPAAWTSTDGRTWTRATVPGASGTGARLTEVVAGVDGLFALGRTPGGHAATDWAPTSGWASADGLTWVFEGDLGARLPYVDALSGDGSHLVLFGRQSSGDTAYKGWSSTDGVTWTRLAFSGSTNLPALDQHDPAHVVPDGVVVVGFQPDVPDESIWFASATSP